MHVCRGCARIGSAWIMALWATGCAMPPPASPTPQRCTLEVWYRPAMAAAALGLALPEASHPELLGDWDKWQRPGRLDWERIVGADGTDWRYLAIGLPPGPHLYGILVGSALVLDQQNPQSAFIADPFAKGGDPFGTEVSLAVLPDCSLPALQMGPIAATTPASPPTTVEQQTGALRFQASFLPAQSGAAAGQLHAELVSAGGTQAVAAQQIRLGPPAPAAGDPTPLTPITVDLPDLAPGKYTLTLWAADGSGAQAPPLTATAFVEPPGQAPLQMQDAVVYEIMVDRFRGDRPGALAPPGTPGERAGGTLGGVLAMLQAGYFAGLGVNTLWLTPVYTNPDGFFTGLDGHQYQAYHGYWPAAPRAVEPLFGAEAALDAVIAAAHQRGVRVILDMVPHHVFEQHPYYLQRSRQDQQVAGAADPSAASWFDDGPAACVCGAAGCDWGSHMETCWFDTYLPTLNWRQPLVMEQGSADLLFWLQRFDLDGFRIDAVPMMSRPGTRRMMRTLRDAVHAGGLSQLLIGETYTGGGDDGRDQIRAYLGAQYDGLDTQFDFPLMWALRDVVAHGIGGFDSLEQEIAASDQAYAGLTPAIAHILDNHDTSRFLSEANGDGGQDPWAAPPPQPAGAAPYARQVLGLTLLLTLPGIPVLYYGDELALAGATDPDSRRVLPDPLTPLPPLQQQVLRVAQRLGRLRACVSTLRRGLRTPLYADADHDVALHQPQPGAAPLPGDGPVLVVLSRQVDHVTLSVPGVPLGGYHDVLSESSAQAALTVDQDPAIVPAAPLAAAVYLPEGHPCL